MHETTDSQHFKLKRGGDWVHQWNYRTIANSNLLQTPSMGCLWSRLL